MINFIANALNVITVASAAAIGAYQYNDVKVLEKINEFTQEEFHCLQQNMYFESRNQSDLSMRAVGWVVLNRMTDERYPSTICEVVWDEKQFSWTHDGKPDRPGDNVLEQRAWERAEKLAQKVVRNWARGASDPVDGSTHYHATYVNPGWASSLEEVAQIDDHIFYRWN